jgi:transposase
MNETANSLRVLGCDVGKDSIVIFDTASSTDRRIDNTAKALKRYFTGLDGQAFVICEATGGYEKALLNAAFIAGLPVHRGDPRKISAFLRSLRPHGKTDRIDARGLARYGAERHNELIRWSPPAKAQEHLQSLVRLRIDVVRTRADYVRRQKAPGSGPGKRHIAALIKGLDRRIDAIEADILALLDSDAHLGRVVAIIEAIPGCGRKTSITLAAVLPELGQMTRRRASSLAGLAPHPWDTGNYTGYRHVRGGRKDAKTALFIASLSARRYNPQLKAFADRLLANGKKPIVVAMAVARKLITIINAKIRDAIFLPEQQLS